MSITNHYQHNNPTFFGKTAKEGDSVSRNFSDSSSKAAANDSKDQDIDTKLRAPVGNAFKEAGALLASIEKMEAFNNKNTNTATEQLEQRSSRGMKKTQGS